jgi:hypothetical protein
MTSVDQDFVWPVPEAGFAWVSTTIEIGKSRRQRQPILGEVCPRQAPAVGRTYRPLHQYSGLFLVFADTDPTPEGVLLFAKRFGRLTRPQTAGRPAVDDAGRPVRLTDECLELWLQQIEDVKRTAGLWHDCQSGKAERLAGRIDWSKDAAGHPVVSYLRGPEEEDVEEIASRTFHAGRLARLSPGDACLPALFYVQDAINARIDALAHPQLLWDPDANQLALRLVPDSLLACIWLQFAAAVANNTAFRQCGQCDLWFELLADGGRTTKQFCSGSCRTRAHRTRQDNACQLHRRGKSLKEIAAAMGADVPTVRKWLKRLAD